MSNKKSVTGGFAWTFAERFGAQAVSFVVSIVLARLLMPEDYGLIAIVLIFINILNAFVTSGLGASLIQKKDADEIDFSSAFHFNLLFSIFLYILIFISAPYVEDFFKIEDLCPVMRVIGLRIILTGINAVQKAHVSRNMQFKKFFFATLFGTVLSAVVGIGLAYNGFGVWALVAQYLTNTFVDTIVLWMTITWNPKMYFRWDRLKGLISYGWKLLASTLLSTVYVELNELVIGKAYSPGALAFYSRGKKFPAIFVTNINSAIETVMFPFLSSVQDDKDKLKEYTRHTLRMGSFFIFPLSICMAAASQNIVLTLLTEKWLDCVIFLQLSCISYALLPVNIINIQVIKAVGRSDIYLIIDVLKKIVGVALLLVSVKFGVIAIALAEVLSNILGMFINVYPNRKLINYETKQLLSDIIPNMLVSFFTGAIVYSVNYLPLNSIIQLLLQIVVALVVYFALAYIFKLRTFIYVLETIKKKSHG